MLVRQRWLKETNVVEQRGIVELGTETVTVGNEGLMKSGANHCSPGQVWRRSCLHGGGQELVYREYLFKSSFRISKHSNVYYLHYPILYVLGVFNIFDRFYVTQGS